MLTKKRTVALVLAIGLALGAAACGDDDAGTNGATDPGENDNGAPDPGDAPVVRVVTATPTNAGTWDPAQRRAYDAAAEAGGWDVEIAEALPYGEAEQVFNSWGDAGVDVVFSTDNGFEDAFLAAAERYPDTAWVMMSGLSTTNDLPNVAAYSPDWCDIGFLQGATGALVSETGTIGGVGAIEILPAQLTVEAMEFAAQTAADGTDVLVEYSGDFVDVQRATETASALIGRDADVIVGVTQGGTTPQIAARVQEAGLYFIGSYDDEEPSAPDAVVTSVLLSFEAGYQESVDTWLDGTFEPTIFTKGYADGFIEMTDFRLGFEDAQQQVEDLMQQLLDGDLSYPPGNMCAGS